MATKLKPSELAEIQYIARHNAHLFPKEANALLDHITALEEELKDVRGQRDRHDVICKKRVAVLAEARGLLNEAKYPPKVADGCLSRSIADYVRLLLNDWEQLKAALAEIQAMKDDARDAAFERDLLD